MICNIYIFVTQLYGLASIVTPHPKFDFRNGPTRGLCWVSMGSLLNISLFIIATVIAVCYVIYSLIVAYQSSVKMSNRYTSSCFIHTYLDLLAYLTNHSSTGSNETRDIEDSQDALFGLFYFLIFIISLNRLR